MAQRKQIEEDIGNRIIELLDQGELPPWSSEWRKSGIGLPINAVSNRPYTGINRWLVLITQNAGEYSDHRWVTFKQAQDLGGHVRRGEKATRIAFYKPGEARSDQDQENELPEDGSIVDAARPAKRRPPILRLYNVFNVEQTEGCEKLKSLEELAGPAGPELPPIEMAEEIVRNMPGRPKIITYQWADHPPHYSPGFDHIKIPERNRYDSSESWYSTLFHELSHSTGHRSRLDRWGQKREEPGEGIHRYGQEELVAEMGAALLSAKAKTAEATVVNSAAYIKHWRDVISGDKAIVMRAAGMAQKAADHILQDGRDPGAARPAEAGAALAAAG